MVAKGLGFILYFTHSEAFSFIRDFFHKCFHVNLVFFFVFIFHYYVFDFYISDVLQIGY